jgi:hypothetical protein
MKVFNKRFVQAAAALGVVATLALVTPRAAHAVAAALVQVTNTTENPAITQSVPSQASRLVLLSSSLPPNSFAEFVSAGPGSTGNFALYAVPAGQSLVITAVDITPSVGCSTGSFNFSVQDFLSDEISVVSTMTWTVSAPNTGHFEYPSGIVYPAGSAPLVNFNAASNTSGPCANSAQVNLLGYLTSN